MPSNRIAPPTIRPGGSATRRSIDSAVTLLPQPDFADHPQCFAGPHGKGNAVNRTHDTGSGEEMSAEIVDLQQRGRMQLCIGARIFNGSYAIQE